MRLETSDLSKRVSTQATPLYIIHSYSVGHIRADWENYIHALRYCTLVHLSWLMRHWYFTSLCEVSVGNNVPLFDTFHFAKQGFRCKTQNEIITFYICNMQLVKQLQHQNTGWDCDDMWLSNARHIYQRRFIYCKK